MACAVGLSHPSSAMWAGPMSVRKASSHSSRAGPSGNAETSAKALRIWPIASAWARLAEARSAALRQKSSARSTTLRLGVVVGKHLGLGPRQIGEPALKRLRDAPVQIALPRLQDGLVGGIPNERVLEAVDGVRRLTALRDDIGPDELLQGLPPAAQARGKRAAPQVRTRTPVR